MRLKNEKRKPLTVVYQGKRVIVYPDQEIEGPVQLTIYGLTPVEQKTITKPPTYMVPSIINQVNDNKNINITEIDNTIDYIKNYNQLPSVAICILTKDSFELISDCINSIEDKVNYKNTKIYVFDTGTTDINVLNFYSEKIKKCKFPFQLIHVGEYHFSRNYNTGLKMVDTDYYLIQNNDTVALNDYISKLMKISIIKKIGVTGPRMLYKDGRIQHDGQLLYNHSGNTFAGPTHVNLGRNTRDVETGRSYADGITCAGMLVRSKVYWEVGGLDEKYNDIFQDVDLNIKIRMAGYGIICDKDALIYHYDNTSRNKFWAKNNEKLKLKHADHMLLLSKINSELKYRPLVSKKLSIITLVNNKDMYINFLNDLKKQTFKYDIELIALPNFNNEYKSCAEALNIGLDISTSDYSILCHQDLRCDENWLEKIFENIRDLTLDGIKWGVLGMAGSWYTSHNNEGGVIFLNDANYNKNTKYTEVQCLDELCLIVANNNQIRFDEVTTDGYHNYGSDFCLNYINNGFRNFAINAPCTHLSDGIGNFKRKESLEDFMNTSVRLFKKWRGIFKSFRNTTSRYSANENSIEYYIADPLRKINVNIKNKYILED